MWSILTLSAHDQLSANYIYLAGGFDNNEIIDTKGSQMRTGQLQDGRRLSDSGLKEGLYLLEIMAGDIILTSRFIIER